MHPPFIFTDHKVGPDPHAVPDTRPVKRNRPTRLDMTPATVTWPPVPLIAPPVQFPLAPSGQPIVTGLRLTVVPPPRGTLRDTIGRWLIRTGQRMILQKRLG